ncbi:MAG: c-type cytochrome [Betaproteobacteria bacterium]|nr:c-type cytochrome [Betaproteobacteria bacterium]
MPKHIVRLMILVAVVAAAAVGAKAYFTDKSYYRYGHYRGDSVAEIAGDSPRFRGNAYCKSCHQKQYAAWESSPHNNPAAGKHVRCEVCHGPVGQHPSSVATPLSFDERIALGGHAAVLTDKSAASGSLSQPKDRTQCIQCHEAMPGRPAAQRQVALASHSGMAACNSCHDPHEPKINFSELPRPAQGNPVLGKTLAAQCAACHGPDGHSVNPEWPNLASQHAGYLLKSLQAFKAGTRTNEMMSGMAAGLSDADMENLSAYFSKEGCKRVAGDQALASLGKARSATCALCHGAAGVGGNPSWPNLAGQNVSYLTASLKSFRSGSRSHPVMTSVAKTLSDDDIDRLAAFYASANCK